MNKEFRITEDFKFNLHLWIKKCGLKKKHISSLIGECRQMIFHDFNGGEISEYRMRCYEVLISFLKDLYRRGLVFEKNPKDSARLTAIRRDKFVVTLKRQFLDLLEKGN